MTVDHHTWERAGGLEQQVGVRSIFKPDTSQGRQRELHPIVRLRVRNRRSAAAVPIVLDPRWLRLVVHLERPVTIPNDRCRHQDRTGQLRDTSLPRHIPLRVTLTRACIVEVVTHHERVADVLPRTVELAHSVLELTDCPVIHKQLSLAFLNIQGIPAHHLFVSLAARLRPIA